MGADRKPEGKGILLGRAAAVPAFRTDLRHCQGIFAHTIAWVRDRRRMGRFANWIAFPLDADINLGRN